MAIEPLPEQAVAGGRNGVSLASADDRNGSKSEELILSKCLPGYP
jgi:hypothetical protein